MNNIINDITKYPHFYYTSGTTEAEIVLAEKELNTRFANDYREILFKYGVISLAGHELLGIISNNRLNVVYNTIEEKNNNENISNQFYVIERTGVDNILVLQDSSGKIYECFSGQIPKCIYNNMNEYIKSFI